MNFSLDIFRYGNLPRTFASVLVCLSLLTACGGSTAPTTTSTLTPLPPLDTPRSFRLALTPFANGVTDQAKNAAWTFVKQHSDLVALHFDTTNGLPWDILETGNLPADLPADFRKEFDEAAAQLNDGSPHTVYVAINPLNSSRTGMQPQYGGGAFPFGTTSSDQSFDNPRVQTALINYAKWIVDTFNPAFLAIGIEANIYDINEINNNITDGGGFQAFVRCYQAVYDAIKASHPTLPIFPTQQLEYMQGSLSTWNNEMALYGTKIDRIGLSMYPSSQNLLPSQLTQAYVTDLLPFNTNNLPIVVTETGYGSEPFSGSFIAPGSPELQRDYLKWLIAAADALPDAVKPDFIVWFFPTDAPLAATPAFPDAAYYLSMGLSDKNLNPRETQLVWDQQLTRPLQPLR